MSSNSCLSSSQLTCSLIAPDQSRTTNLSVQSWSRPRPKKVMTCFCNLQTTLPVFSDLCFGRDNDKKMVIFFRKQTFSLLRSSKEDSSTVASSNNWFFLVFWEERCNASSWPAAGSSVQSSVVAASTCWVKKRCAHGLCKNDLQNDPHLKGRDFFAIFGRGKGNNWPWPPKSPENGRTHDQKGRRPRSDATETCSGASSFAQCLCLHWSWCCCTHDLIWMLTGSMTFWLIQHFGNKWKTFSLFWSSQCFQLDISWANIAHGKICANFMCWADSFIIDWLVSAGGGLLTPVETWSVSTDTVDFVIRVDKKLWVDSGLFKNCNCILSLAHKAQFLVAKVLTTLIGLPCQMMLQIVPSCWLNGDRFASWNWVAKRLAHESDFSPSLTSFGTSLKCCCIPALNFCCVFPVHNFPVSLNLTLWTAVEFLRILF